MDKKNTLPARPNLEHLRGQAKKLLDELSKNSASIASSASTASSGASAGDKPKLADAQLAVAREAGFASWPKLVKHVETLRSLEGEWRIATLEIDGNDTPAMYLEGTRILMDGDRFRTESPEANYEGIFSIDLDQEPAHFDIHFVAGPEAGNTSRGILRIDGDDAITLCLPLGGSQRPAAFATTPGSGFALESLRRASRARPQDVTGGTPPSPTAEAGSRELPRGNSAEFSFVDTPLVRRLQGSWIPLELVIDGKPMPDGWLVHGKRTMTENHMTVVFGGQTMIDADVRIDESASPIAIDFLHTSGRDAGTVAYGILDWQGDELRTVIAAAGDPRPAGFDAPPKGTLVRWRRAQGA